MRIGIGTWGYTMEHAPQFEKLARELAAEDYDGIELDGGVDYFHPSKYASIEARQELVEHVSSLGLAISGYNPAFCEFDITSPDSAERDAYMAAVSAAVDFCSDCHISTMRLDTGQGPHAVDLTQTERVRRVVDTWREAARIAGARGVRLAWEFEPGFMCNKPSEIVSVVEAIDEPAFGVLFDICHAHMVTTVGARQEPPLELLPGGEVELARRLAGRIHLVHLIDSDETLHDGFTSTHTPFGHGVIDFPRVMEAIVAAKYQGPWWTVDLCFYPDPASWTRQSLHTVRELLADPSLQRSLA
jgi:sugar phosphate isomerase/epimerase